MPIGSDKGSFIKPGFLPLTVGPVTPIPAGALWVTGYNNYGQLGLGDTVTRSSPTQVGAYANWVGLSGARYCSFGTKTDGTLWSWGRNNRGQLGVGDTTDRSSPVQVGALTNWATLSSGSIAGNDQFVLAVKANGTLYAWGYNGSAQLGDGTYTTRSSPVQLGSLTTWAECSAGAAAGYAIKTDGTIWSWGSNNNGALGLNEAPGTNHSFPTQIGALTNWLKVSAGTTFVSALKTDGTIWAWGLNSQGMLGQGNTTSYSSPVQIGALTTWLSVSSGYSQMHGITTGGALWSWGQNNSGQLGINAAGDRSSPVQVGALTTWASTSPGSSQSVALKTDGTAWGWGYNGQGALGTGTLTDTSSPVQIGALTSWLRLAVRPRASFTLLSKP